MNNDELYHYGVKGMKWGVRRNRSSLDGNGSFRTRRLQRAVNANDRDVKSLKSAGYKKEAAAVKAVGDKNRAKLAKSQARDAARNTKKYRTQVMLNGKTMGEYTSNARQSAQAKIQQTKQKLSTPEAKAKIDKAAKTAKVGAAVAGVALAAYGGYKLNKYARDINYQYRMQQGKEYAKDLVKQGFVDEIITDKTYSWDATPAYRMAAEAARNTAKSDRLPTAIANTIRYKRLYG